MFVPLFVQIVAGHSATNSGVVLMPMMFAAIAASIGAGQFMARTGRYSGSSWPASPPRRSARTCSAA